MAETWKQYMERLTKTPGYVKIPKPLKPKKSMGKRNVT